MGVPLFGVDIAGKINRALGPKLRPATLTKRVTDPTIADDTGSTSTTHSARGVVIDYDDRHVDGTRIQRTDRQIMLLGDSITPAAEPEPDDTIAIEGQTYVVVRATSDPAKAQWTCQARQR